MNVAAFFDLDGTLIPRPSLERRFLRFLAWRGELRASNAARWVARLVLRAPLNYLHATDGNKAHLAGVPVESVATWAAFLGRYPIQIFPQALHRLAWHFHHGHKIFVVTGSLEPLAQHLLSRLLPFPVTLCATRLDSRRGFWTGRTTGAPVCGLQKARIVREFSRAPGLDLTRSFAYGDSFADRWMLAAVGHPLVVNPSTSMSFFARLRGWPVCDWTEHAPRPPIALPAEVSTRAHF
jgi:HAD superfamily hydrolase (TIGR01490 family)